MIGDRPPVIFALNIFGLCQISTLVSCLSLTIQLRRFRTLQYTILGRLSHHSSESRLRAKNKMGEQLGLSLQLTCSFQPHFKKRQVASLSYHQLSQSAYQPSNFSSVSFISSFIFFAWFSTASSGSEVHSPIAICSCFCCSPT
jgi:hypothetical protein